MKRDALKDAARYGEADLLERLFRCKAKVDGDSGSTPLMQAAKKGHEDCINILLKYNADAKIKYNGYTALQIVEIAGRERHDRICKILSKLSLN